MPTNHNFRPFGIVTVIICLPTYMLIGSLNTTSGLRFWTQKTHDFFTRIARIFAAFLALFGYKPKWAQTLDAGTEPQRSMYPVPSPHVHTYSIKSPLIYSKLLNLPQLGQTPSHHFGSARSLLQKAWPHAIDANLLPPQAAPSH